MCANSFSVNFDLIQSSQISTILQGDNYGFLINPSYCEDGLITFHLCEFMQDEKFMKAYALGKGTGALRTHPTDIHWRVYVACWAANWAKSLEGDFVECGVSLGLISRAVVDYVHFNTLQKKFYLFDTYAGIPDGVLNDKEKALGAGINPAPNALLISSYLFVVHTKKQQQFEHQLLAALV